MSRDELILATGYTDRRIREAIEALRHIRPILNLDDGDGYYIPDTTHRAAREAALWLSRQDRRIQSMKDATTGARRFLNKRKVKMSQDK